MIFDSKRRQSAQLEAEATTLAEAPRPARSTAPDDVRSSPTGASGAAELEVYPVDESSSDRTVETPDAGFDDRPGAPHGNSDELEPLFATDVAGDFRRDWDAVQIGFVDDPRKAVHDADDLVNRVLKNLTETFTRERSHVEAQVAQAGPVSTEDLRVALRRYRSFLHRLLSL
ncbi:hypothetical protein VAR608DRAFT_6479 [Variovorax sp. HW608]|uniref:hypothetical protein n=1 Tax=Variovorax sp. HW608 TaxID=1034889 RepID=UPI00081FB0C7|nr:hypothetical protein [Variovorax sp. HW608]SCK59594.1 hypothetical protein VAR608DRAFT_6479 [Variovorax sp. HW608]